MKSANLIPLQDAAATGGSGTIVSTYYDLGDDVDFSVQVYFSGSNVVGTLTLQCCVSDPTNDGFVTVDNSSQAVTASAGHVYNVTGAGYRYVNVKWVYTSGTGNIRANLTVKE